MTDNEAAREKAREVLNAGEDLRGGISFSSYGWRVIHDRLTSLLAGHAEELAIARAALLDLSNRVAFAAVALRRDLAEARGLVEALTKNLSEARAQRDAAMDVCARMSGETP